MSDKKAQTMGMPFAVIFSIILIVFFIVVAGIVVRHFLSLQKCSEISIFLRDFQDKVDTVWKSSAREEVFQLNLPGAIDEVCFVDFNKTVSAKYLDVERRYGFYKPNFFFYPPEKACEVSYYTFKHINMTEATKSTNPFCITIKDSSIIISKDFYETLVRIRKG